MNIIVGSKFTPFTYDQLSAPVKDYTEAYNKVDEDYSNLAAQTEYWKDLVNREKSPEAYAMYKAYADQLNAVVDDFSKGMTVGNRRALIKMKRGFSRSITPIANAEAARREAVKYRDEARSRDNSVVFKVNDFSIDNFLHGNTVSNEFVSGKDVLARTSAKAEALGKALFSDPEFNLVLGGQQYQVSSQNGLTPDALMAVINNNLDNPNISDSLRTKLQSFRQIVDEEMANVEGYDAQSQLQILNSVNTGLYAGLAKPTYNYVANGEYMSKAERDASARGWDNYRLSASEFEYRQQQDAKASGQLPYRTEENKGYFSDGITMWTATKDSSGNWVKDTSSERPVKSGGAGTTVTESVDANGNVTRTTTITDGNGNKSQRTENAGNIHKSLSGSTLAFDAYYNDTSSGIDWKGSSRDWNDDDMRLLYSRGTLVGGDIAPNRLSDKAKGQINTQLKEYNLTWADVDIWVDHDRLNDSHYAIVAHGETLPAWRTNKYNKGKKSSSQPAGIRK